MFQRISKQKKMEAILNLLNSEANFNITIQKSDLIDFAKFMISFIIRISGAEVFWPQHI